jgi:peptide/nickel transport system substrate-binding protein
MAQLRTGDLDLDNFVSATNWQSLESNDGITNRRDRSTMTIGIIGNLEHENVPDAYADPRVRRALQRAIDRESFADAVFDGEANAVSIPTLPGSWWHYPEHQEKNLYDLEGAKRLMNEAGYSDGFEVQLNVGSDSWHQTMGQVVKSMWSKLDVTVNLNPMESTTMWTRISQGEQPLSISEHLAPPDPDWFLRGYLVPPEDAPDQTTNGLNGWEHDEYFSLAREARYTRDQEERKRKYRRLNEIYAEEMPMIWFSNGYNLAVHKTELEDYWLYPGDYSREANRYVAWQS